MTTYLDACKEAVIVAARDYGAADRECHRRASIADEAVNAMQAAAEEASRLRHVLDHARRRLDSAQGQPA